MLSLPPVNPARSYEDALQRIAAIQARDGDRVAPQARTAFLGHGSKAETAIVLLHGFTNHPGQYGALAPLLFERGANVFVPRLPEHGFRDRMSTGIAVLQAGDFLACAAEAADIAHGLGERVCVLGISSSGLLAGWLAQERSDVARAVAVSPVFAALHLPYTVSRIMGVAMRSLPNAFLWWDPRDRTAQRPRTAYPRFPTRVLGEILRIADDLLTRAKRVPFAGGSIAVVTSASDPAVNNAVTRDVLRAWRARRPDAVLAHEIEGLPRNHDIIDPDNAAARVEAVYPTLLEYALGV